MAGVSACAKMRIGDSHPSTSPLSDGAGTRSRRRSASGRSPVYGKPMICRPEKVAWRNRCTKDDALPNQAEEFNRNAYGQGLPELLGTDHPD